MKKTLRYVLLYANNVLVFGWAHEYPYNEWDPSCRRRPKGKTHKKKSLYSHSKLSEQVNFLPLEVITTMEWNGGRSSDQ